MNLLAFARAISVMRGAVRIVSVVIVIILVVITVVQIQMIDVIVGAVECVVRIVIDQMMTGGVVMIVVHGDRGRLKRDRLVKPFAGYLQGFLFEL